MYFDVAQDKWFMDEACARSFAVKPRLLALSCAARNAHASFDYDLHTVGSGLGVTASLVDATRQIVLTLTSHTSIFFTLTLTLHTSQQEYKVNTPLILYAARLSLNM